MSTDNQIEQEIQAKGLLAPRIKPADIEANIVSEHYFTAGDGFAGALSVSPEFNELPDNERIISPPPELDMVTICVLITKNGTKLVGANTGPVSPSNFNPELARKLARQAATDQLWPMLGYELRSKLTEAAIKDAATLACEG